MRILIKPRCHLGLMLLGLCSAVQAAQFAPEVGGGIEMSRVWESKIVQIGALPTVIVRAEGDKYDTVGIQGFGVDYKVRGRCKGIWDLHFLTAQLRPSSLIGGWSDADPGDKSNAIYFNEILPYNVDSGKRTHEENGTVSGGVVVPQLVAEDAIKHCNKDLNKRMAESGQSRFKTMQKESILGPFDRAYSPVVLQTYLLCGKNTGGLFGNDAPFSYGYQQVKMNYQCMAKTQSAPKGLPKDLKTLPSVQSVSLSKPIPSGNIPIDCPVEVGVSGSVKVTGGENVAVQYRWRRSDGYVSPVLNGSSSKLLNIQLFNTSHKFLVKDVKKPLNSKGIKQGNEPVNSQQGWVQLEVLKPSKKASTKMPYNIACKQPVPAQKPDLSVHSLTIAGKSPDQGTIELSSNDALAKTPSGCAFAVGYRVRNQSPTNVSKAFSTKVSNDIKVIATTTTQNAKGSLWPKQNMQIVLKDGLHALRLELDKPNSIDEKNEANNHKDARVVVSGCGG